MMSLIRKVVACTLVAAVGCQRSGQESIYTVDTPDGRVMATKSVEGSDAAPQAVAIVTGDELTHLQSLDDAAGEFHDAYRPAVASPSLKDFDAAFLAWQKTEQPPHDAEEVIAILGSLLGNRCIEDFDMEWVSVEDDYGTAYGVRAKRAEVMIFPFEAVSKRVETGEHDFLHSIYFVLKDTLENGEYAPRSPGE